MGANALTRVLFLVLAVALLKSSLYEAAQILSMEAMDVEVLENQATELRCVVTLSNPDSKLATVTMGKLDSSELLASLSNVSQQLSIMYEIASASKGDEGRYRCNASVEEIQMNVTFFLSVIDHVPPYVIGNPDHYNSVNTLDTHVVDCDVMGVPQPMYEWEKDGQPIGSTPLNDETGPYVAANGSLLLDKALPSDSGVYVCYGIDPLTGKNATSYYAITIEQGSSIWGSWYLILTYVVVFMAALFIIALVCFFVIGTRDICIDIRDRKQFATSNSSMLNAITANPAYEINFNEGESDASFAEETEHDSSDEDLDEDVQEDKNEMTGKRGKEMVESNAVPSSKEIQGLTPEHQTSTGVDSTTSGEDLDEEVEEDRNEMTGKREKEMMESNAVPSSKEIQGLMPEHQTSMEVDPTTSGEDLDEEVEGDRNEMTGKRGKKMVESNAIPSSKEIQGLAPEHQTSTEVDSTTSGEDSDDERSLVTGSQSSSSLKQSQPTKKPHASGLPSGPIAKDDAAAAHQKLYEEQKDPPKKSKKGRQGKNQKYYAPEMLY